MGKPPTPLHNIIIQAITNLLTNNIYFLVCDLLEARIGEKKIVCAYYNHQNHFILTIMSTSLFCTLSWMENYEKLPIKSGILAQKCYGAVVRIAELFLVWFAQKLLLFRQNFVVIIIICDNWFCGWQGSRLWRIISQVGKGMY